MRDLHDTFLRPEDFSDPEELQPDEPLRFFRGLVVGIGGSLCLLLLAGGIWIAGR